MPGKPKHKMPIEQRAKQFLPFAALGGLEEALEQKAQEVAAQYEKTRRTQSAESAEPSRESPDFS